MLKKILSEENAKRIIKYTLIWISIYWLNIWITFFCREILLLSSENSYFITMSIIAIYSFMMSLKIIFKVDFKVIILIKYLFYLISFSSMNYFLVICLKNSFWENYIYLIIIFINTILAIIKYFVYSNFVFNKSIKW